MVDPVAQADRLAVQADEGFDRRAAPLTAEGRKGLAVFAIFEGSDCQQLCCQHRSLATPSMDADFNRH
jgi:hypothetical protein